MSIEISKDEKERQLDAKIAAIRAKNEEKIQRQREVEKDRKLAERQNQSITTAPRVKEEYEHQFVGPDRNDKAVNVKQKLRRDDSQSDRKDKRSGGRLRDGDGPPPDPGYRFLADRMRDGSESEGEEEDGQGKRRENRRREDVQPWSRGGGGSGGGFRGGVGGRGGHGRGGGGSRGRGGDKSREGKWSNDHDRRDNDSWETDSRGGGDRRWESKERGGRSRGGPRGGAGSNNRVREERTESFIKDIRRNVDSDKRGPREHPLMRTDSSDWTGSTKQSPRHKPRPLMSGSRSGGNIGDWSDQVEDGDWARAQEAQPPVPTAMVSPRKIEDVDGKLTVTKASRHHHHAAPSSTSPTSKQQMTVIKPLQSDSSYQSEQRKQSRDLGTSSNSEPNYPYGVEPPPFKENKSSLIQPDIGFSQYSGGPYNKPFSSPDNNSSPSSSWKCPDPGCKQVNGQNRNNCVKCGISYKAANDYINNYACDKVKQEYSSSKNMIYNKAENGYSNVSSNGPPANGFSSSGNPAIPQPMLAQAGIKDWNIDVEQSNWGAGSGHNQPLTTTMETWTMEQHSNMMYAGHMDPNMQYGMMMSQVQVPSYPPPFYNQPHMQGAGPYFNASNSDFYPQPSPADYSAGYQGQPSNLSVFNPTAQVYVPTQPDHSHVYKAPPPFTNQAQSKGFTNSKPFPTPTSTSMDSSDPNLMLSLNKPPNPLSLRKPQEAGLRPVSKLQERLNQNRQSQERERPPIGQRQGGNGQQSGKLPPRLQQSRPTSSSAQQKPPSMVEMQSGSLKKGSMILPPPGKGNGLLIFGCTSVEETHLSSQLNVPVKLIPCPKLETFQEKAILLNPSRDWLVLLHGLGSDARAIADTKKSDVDKANDADDVANMFCDIIENKILTSAAHIYVLVSMLLPRIDQQEASGMGNPNNVRKVINVQITQRLYENPRVSLINSDKILDWGEDDVRLNQLIKPDGFSLTPEAHNLVLTNWVQHIKKKMSDVNFVPNNNKPSSIVRTISREDTSSLVKESKVEPIVDASTKNDINNEDHDQDEEEDDTVNDPFGSYKAPCELVSRPRTISTSGPNIEEADDVDDDSLPNLETVNNNSSKPEEKLVDGFKSVAISESKLSNGVNNDDNKPEFHDSADGFIEDNYCGSEEIKTQPLPSMMSLGPSSDAGQVSGHFMEDSYLPTANISTSLNMTTVELSLSTMSSTCVKIAGDFNSWQPQDMEKGAESTWRFLIDLPPGSYQYKYLVAGDWVLDEKSQVVEKDGNKNNVIDVK